MLDRWWRQDALYGDRVPSLDEAAALAAALARLLSTSGVQALGLSLGDTDVSFDDLDAVLVLLSQHSGPMLSGALSGLTDEQLSAVVDGLAVAAAPTRMPCWPGSVRGSILTSSGG